MSPPSKPVPVVPHPPVLTPNAGRVRHHPPRPAHKREELTQ